MDDDTRRFLGRILGEVLRLQRRTDPSMVPYGDDHIYALLNGFEHAIDEVLEDIGSVSRDQVDAASRVLDRHWSDQAAHDQFEGFYDVERELQEAGVDRGTAIRILKFFWAQGSFQSLIAKMNSNSSPIECKQFDLSELEK